MQNNMKRLILLIFFVLFICGCKDFDSKINIVVKFDSEKKVVSIENKKTNHEYDFYNELYLNLSWDNLEPVYCIDSLNNLLYIYDLGHSVRLYNLKKDSLINEIDIRYREPESHNIKLLEFKHYVVLKSNWRCDILDKEFKDKISLFDTIYHSNPICYRYTTDFIPKIKNDTLFLTVNYHGGIIDTLIHNSNYIYDLKKKEFITHLEPCKKNLSNGNP